jgi:hypothetical protein
MEQKCPLCFGNSEFEFVDHENHKHFLCKTCVEFILTEKTWSSGPGQRSTALPFYWHGLPSKRLCIKFSTFKLAVSPALPAAS